MPLIDDLLCLLPSQPLNQVIIWDTVVDSPDKAYLKEINEFVEYALIDQGEELRYSSLILPPPSHSLIHPSPSPGTRPSTSS